MPQVSRTLGVVAGFAATLGTATIVWLGPLWNASVEQGREKYGRRFAILNQLTRKNSEIPLIAWLGDSTMLRGISEIPPYPDLIRRELRGSQPFTNVIVAIPAQDAYHHYSLLGAVLELKPKAVFILANLRLFGAPRVTNFLDLASWIPPAELGRALWLPWHERSITIPRLVMAQALRHETAEKVFFAAEGLRELFQNEVLPLLSRAGRPSTREEGIARTLREYTEELDGRHPVLRMIVAAVEMATRRGVRAVVVIPPMPLQAVERAGIAAAPSEQAAALRRAVEPAGGELVALYDLLGAEGFRDEIDHLTMFGTRQVANALTPVVKASLPSSR
jgi:hypothetical protein